MAQTPVKDVAFSHIDLLKTVVDFKMKFSLFGKVFLLYINSFLYVFHHFYSFSIMGSPFYTKLSCNLLEWNF